MSTATAVQDVSPVQLSTHISTLAQRVAREFEFLPTATDSLPAHWVARIGFHVDDSGFDAMNFLGNFAFRSDPSGAGEVVARLERFLHSLDAAVAADPALPRPLHFSAVLLTNTKGISLEPHHVLATATLPAVSSSGSTD